MRSTHVLIPSLISLVSFACLGCGDMQPTDVEAAGNRSDALNGPPIARLEPSELEVGTDQPGMSQRRGRSATDALAGDSLLLSPTELLQAMVATYRTANAYSDEGFVLLRYEQNGQLHEDRAPLSVKFQRDKRIKLVAYAAQIAIQNGTFRAAVEDPVTRNFDHQVVDVILPTKQLDLQQVYSEPTVTHFATAGLGGPSPQLELLLSEDPLSGLFEGEAKLSTTAAAEIDGVPCAGLQVASDDLVYRFWIDLESSLLRRVELPPESAGLDVDGSVSNVQLSIELPNAKLAVSETSDWRIKPPPGEIPVQYLVPPPPPLVSTVLGKRVAAFEIRSADNNLVVRTDNAADQMTVLLWVANHPASYAAARELQSIADQRVRTNQDTRFVIVMAEPSYSEPGASAQLLRSWNVGLPVVDDLQAVGRDVFGVSEAPTLAVLTPDGVLQWFQPRVGPDIATGIPALLDDLAKGVTVGKDLAQQHRVDMQTYQRLVNEARSRPASAP